MTIPSPLLQSKIGDYKFSWRISKLPPFDRLPEMLTSVHALAQQMPKWRNDDEVESLIARKLAALKHGIRDMVKIRYSSINDMIVLSLARAVSIATTLQPESEPAVNNNRIELCCWVHNVISKLAERRGGDVKEMTNWFKDTMRAVFGDCVILGELITSNPES